VVLVWEVGCGKNSQKLPKGTIEKSASIYTISVHQINQPSIENQWKSIEHE